MMTVFHNVFGQIDTMNLDELDVMIVVIPRR